MSKVQIPEFTHAVVILKLILPKLNSSCFFRMRAFFLLLLELTTAIAVSVNGKLKPNPHESPNFVGVEGSVFNLLKGLSFNRICYTRSYRSYMNFKRLQFVWIMIMLDLYPEMDLFLFIMLLLVHIFYMLFHQNCLMFQSVSMSETRVRLKNFLFKFSQNASQCE